MSEGQQAAENTKSVFKEATGATESLRRNINSFADNLLGGNKDGTHVNDGTAPVSGHKTTHTHDATGAQSNSGILGSSSSTTSTTANSGSGIHPDAQFAGSELEKAGQKIGEAFSKK